ncbi:hypothetical protein ACSNOI_33005 [Actinomadura kijaniata]|uniref:hypothetical protein n=1 Tax=Actinomadura kijaniata TaxID=46161 RepID=UPI003F1CDAD6
MGTFAEGPPEELVAAAAAQPGGWVYEIDSAWVDDPDGHVPPEAIRGGWKVGDDGRLTGEFHENPRYAAVRDDYSALDEPDQWMGWLGENPGAYVREQIADILNRQVEGSVLEWLLLRERARCLTGARRDEGDGDTVLVTRTGFVVAFVLAVRPPHGRQAVLNGVFTWAAAGLDRPGARRDRVWFDLDAGLDWAEEQLKTRIYEVGG